MQKIFDHQSETPTANTPIEAEYTLPDAGWICLRIRPLHELYAVHCSYIRGPFAGMMRWLEEIAQGNDAATWCIDEEGTLSRLQFYSGSLQIGDHADFLLHVQSDDLGITRVRGVHVDRRQLVESIYRAFRAMAENPAYSASEWEAHPRYPHFDDMTEAECDEAMRAFPYGGSNLRKLKSSVIEEYLALEFAAEGPPGAN
jgi:hypothetical protein